MSEGAKIRAEELTRSHLDTTTSLTLLSIQRCNMKLISFAAASLFASVSNSALPPGYEDEVRRVLLSLVFYDEK